MVPWLGVLAYRQPVTARGELFIGPAQGSICFPIPTSRMQICLTWRAQGKSPPYNLLPSSGIRLWVADRGTAVKSATT